MKKNILALAVGLALVAGAGASAHAQAEAPAKASSKESVAPAATLRITPGALGPVKVGLSKSDALATGYLVKGVSPGGDCPAPVLQWRKEDQAKKGQALFDALTYRNGEIASIGIRSKGPRTRSGLGVGSTYGAVERVAGSSAVEAGFGQSGVFIYSHENGGWVGFLFNASVKKLKKTSTVAFVELTKGGRPDLIRDGC